MSEVRSKDGTPIAFDRLGVGPPLIVVLGSLNDRSFAAPLAEALSPHFTVYAYDRRGRGASGNTPPYAVDREIEDIDALISEAGGSAFVYGHSSGAKLALDATARGLAITKLALYEPPFIVDDTHEPRECEQHCRLDRTGVRTSRTDRDGPSRSRSRAVTRPSRPSADGLRS